MKVCQTYGHVNASPQLQQDEQDETVNYEIV